MSSAPGEKRRIAVEGTEIAFVEAGQGNPIVFLHGNPTSSYLWRDVIPHLTPLGRCLAPDLAGMGDSGPLPERGMRLADHAAFLERLLERLGVRERGLARRHTGAEAVRQRRTWPVPHRQSARAVPYLAQPA